MLAHTPAAATPSLSVDAELAAPGILARIVRFDIPVPTDTEHAVHERYHVNMCLTPRPPEARGGYARRWGPHRLERLGDIFVIPPRENLHVKGGTGRQASLTVEIEPSLLRAATGFALSWDDRRLAMTLDIGSAPIRALLLRIVAEVRHPGIAAPRMLDLMGQELAIELGRYCLAISERAATGGLAGWRLRLIDERLAADHASPSLAELADLCGLSVRQLTRGFKVSRACSIGDYIEQRRMEAAKRMLMSGDSVKSAAFALGFSSPSSFTFAFRRAAGMSPSTFRSRQSHALQAGRSGI
jgi:AraC family transcriptional regulator